MITKGLSRDSERLCCNRLMLPVKKRCGHFKVKLICVINSYKLCLHKVQKSDATFSYMSVIASFITYYYCIIYSL